MTTPTDAPARTGLAIAALVLAIVGLHVLVPGLVSILAIVLGIVSRRDASRGGRGMAGWAIGLGAVGLALDLAAQL